MNVMLFMVCFQFFMALKTFLTIAITILMTQYPASITLSTLIPVNSPNVPPMKKKKKKYHETMSSLYKKYSHLDLIAF